MPQDVVEFKIGAQRYQCAPIDLFTQLGIVARISPLYASGFAEMVPFMVWFRDAGISSLDNLTVEKVTQIMTPIAREVAKMSDADRNFVISSCLGAVARWRDPGGPWEPVWNKAANVAMLDDINDAMLALRISMEVVRIRLSSFFPERLFTFLEGATS